MFPLWNLATAVGLFVAMLLLQAYGRRLARRSDAAGDGVQDLRTAQGAVFGVLGLLVAFTFSGALERFEGRRQLVVDEANAIGTAWYRLDVLPAEKQAAAKDLFRQYLDNRIATFKDVSDVNVRRALVEKASELQRRVWGIVVSSANEKGQPSAYLALLPALNNMFDIMTTREAVTLRHPPLVVYIMIGVLACMGAIFSGYGLAGSHAKSWVHRFAFPLVISGALFVIVDLEYPRHGFIRVDAVDYLMADLRKSMG